MKRDHDDFAPGTLVDHGEGRWSLLYSSFPAFDDLLGPRGLAGGGTTWHGMVVHLLEEHAPDALEALDFTPQASMLTAVSDSLDALRAVARMLRKLEDRHLVARIVEYVDLRQYE